MPKGIREPLQELEGGKGFGGMGGGGGGVRYKTTAQPERSDPAQEAKNLKALFSAAGIATGAGLTAASAMDAPNRRAAAERKEKAEREAAAELKRESRGMKAGGTASARADGIAQRGKTKGRMV
jgi:hypothetical protein